jgi:predicted flap endonuclease-1-like 5' DNA nuclease
MLMSATPILILLISNLFIGMLITWFYYRGTMSDGKKKIEKLRTSLKNKDEKLKDLMEKTLEHESNIEGLKKTITKKDKNIRQISAQVKERDDSVSSLNHDLSELLATRDSLNVQLDKQEETISLLRDQIMEKDDSIKGLEEELNALEEKRQESYTRVERAESGTIERDKVIEERDNSIKFMKNELATLEKKAQHALARAETAEAALAKLEKELEERSREAASQKARIRSMQDDLTVVDGIGPRVSSVLRSAGVTSFSKLAERKPEEIKGILVAENPNLTRLIDPSTWREQARMAAAGDWEGLNALQDDIKEGRRAKDLLRREAHEVGTDATVVVN